MKTVSKPSGGTGLSQSAQRDVLAHLALCPQLFHLVRSGKVLQEDINGNLHRFLFVAIHGILDTALSFAEPIPKFLINKELAELVRSGDILREEVPMLMEEIEKLYSSPLSPSFYDESHIMSLVRRQRIAAAVGNAAQNGVDDAVEFQRVVSRIISESTISAGDEETGMLDLLPDHEVFQMLPQAGIEKIPTGIPSLDYRLNGGLAPRKSGMICAFTGVGKSAVTTSFAWGSAQAGFPSLIFSTELGKEEFYRRLMSNVLNVSYSLIEHGARDSRGNLIDREVLNRALNNTRRQMMEEHESIRTGLSMINIVRMADATIDDYKRKAIEVSHKCMDRFGVPLRAVYIDWIDKMQPMKIRGKDPALRHFLASISQEIDDFGKEQGFATWMTTQANDSAEGKAKVGMTAVNESRAKVHPVSIFLGLGTTEQDKANGIWHLTADKYRDGTTFSLRVRGDLDHQRFSDLTAEQMAEPAPGIRIREQRRRGAQHTR